MKCAEERVADGVQVLLRAFSFGGRFVSIGLSMSLFCILGLSCCLSCSILEILLSTLE
jgi:hypothetical protein